MPGIKLHHETLRNCTVAVEVARGYAEPFECPLCGTTHRYKTVHLNLDNEGDVIVSTGVWEDLKDVPMLPLSYDADIKKPPALVLNLNGNGNGKAHGGELAIVHHDWQGRR